MIENKTWFMSRAGRGTDADMASAEPSHIHIARPSRVQRRAAVAVVEPTSDEVREIDPAAEQVTGQAA
jgi:hypothetical protein